MRKRNVFFLLGLILILLLAAAPLIVALGAGAYAANHGCVLHEGFVNPCIVDGQDMGQTLYGLGMVGWFAIATVPLGLGAAAILVFVWILTAVTARKRAKQEAA
jgi:hypothetical protein